MILRNVAVRHGRKALAAPLRKSSLRSLTTESLNHETAGIEHAIDNHAKSIEASVNQSRMTSSFVPPTAEGEPTSEVSRNFNIFRSVKKRTQKLGSVVEAHYRPHELVMNPPRPKDVTLELLLASQAHLGHSTSLWNPANQRYIFGVRQGIHIISLEATAAHLRRAAKVVEGVSYHGGIILFVGTRPGQTSAVVRAAQLAKACHLFDSWTPGSITNSEQILSRCGIKAVDKDDQVIEEYKEKLEDWRALKPDLVVVMNPLENYTLLHECGLNNIPTIGVIDTNADPTWVTYPIPANDDSIRCIQLIAGVLGRAGEEGQRQRLEAAKSDVITWTSPPGLKELLVKPDPDEEDDLEKSAYGDVSQDRLQRRASSRPRNSRDSFDL